MRKMNLSASAIKVFKCCPTHWQLAHVEGLRPIEKADVLRIGSNWHLLMEKYREAQVAAKPTVMAQYKGVDIVGQGTLTDPVDVALEHLNAAYLTVPDGTTRVEWETERAKLAYAFIAYAWYWENEDLETLETEIRFRLPLTNPRTGERLEMDLVGMIDRVVRTPTGRKMVMEHKTTGQDIDPSADFWDKLKLDVQVSTYAFAGKEMDWGIDGTYFDVYRKPATNPRLLTIAESKKFMDSGEWCGAVYEIEGEIDPGTLTIGGKTAEVKLNKKPGAYQIRETPDMYGARLLKDIYANPEKYFQRQEVVRTDKEIEAFRQELANICTNMLHMIENDTFYQNDGPCTPSKRGGCAYPDICYYNRVQAVVDGITPSGYRRIYGEKNDEATPSPIPPCPTSSCPCSTPPEGTPSPAEPDSQDV